MRHFEVEYVKFEEANLYITTHSVTFRNLRAARRWIRRHGEEMGAVRINYLRKDYYKKGKMARMVMYIRTTEDVWVTPSRRYPKFLNLKTGKVSS